MKQLVMLIMLVLIGSTGSLFNPFWGLLLYYGFAVLRPQELWDWALPQDYPWSRLAAGAVLVGVAVNFSSIWRHARLNIVAWIMIAFGLLLLPSILVAHDPGTAFFWGVEYGKVLLLALICPLVIHRFRQVNALALMIVICLGYIAWEANSRYLFDGRLDIFHYGFGELDNNGAGLMLAMGIPLTYTFALCARRWWKRGFFILTGLIMLHAVLMSYSRGAMIATLMAVLWMLWHHRPRLQAAMIVAGIALILPLLAGQEIQQRFTSTTQFHRDYSAQSRFTSWDAAMEIVREHPITGVGIRNSNTYTHNYGADHMGRTIHSQYLQIAADSGVPACLTYTTMMGLALLLMGRCHYKLRRQRRQLTGDDAAHDELLVMEKTTLGLQASLFVFAFGGAFLSLEVFELPWLLMALAGLMPRLVRKELSEMAARQGAVQEESQEEASSAPRPKARRTRPRRPNRPRLTPA